MSLLEKSVAQADDGTYTFTCPGVAGDECGPFTSAAHLLKKHAVARGRQHFDAHTAGSPMPTLDEFRAEHGLIPNDDGRTVRLAEMEDQA